MIIDVRDIPKTFLLKLLYDYAVLALPTPGYTPPTTADSTQDVLPDVAEMGLWERIYSRPVSPLRLAYEHVLYQRNKYHNSVDLGSGSRALNVSFFFLRYFDSSGFDALYGAGAALEAITNWRAERDRERAVNPPRIRSRHTM